ncbi:MAG TPA: hotdog fold thioesterase [Flavobacteriales bacterium]|nr:hotdog fold thioesterase [Flavobacteriales bacterium]HNU56126.1 hotdog fold thioesterase [Flavobacteriales bacterium]
MRFTTQHVEAASALRANTLVEHLDIRFGVDAEGRLQASMPVDKRTHQPMGLLHGGATASLAETLGSVGTALLIDLKTQATVGMEITANHLRGVKAGRVTATGELVHQGNRTHVWDIRVHDEPGRLIAICRLTNMIIDRR